MKIPIVKYDEDYELKLKKRLEKKGLSEDEIIKKSRKLGSGKFMYINREKEDPTITDYKELKPISSRKLWALRHKKKLKKRNSRLERKGIFTY